MTTFLLNQDLVTTGEPAGTTLLEFIRDVKCLSGTKDACREGECGACTVLVGRRRAEGGIDYRAVASCLTPVGAVEGCHVVTVEGLSGADLTLPQRMIVERSASQCGFCTPGIVLSLTAFCLTSERFAYGDALDALDGNICRCTGYVAIRDAARALADRLATCDPDPAKRLQTLVDAQVLPAWMRDAPRRLAGLPAAAPATRAEGTVAVAGGTDLFVQRPEALRDAPLEFLHDRAGWEEIGKEGNALLAGGAVTIESFRRHPLVREHFPFFEKDLLLHSSAILRNRATLAGNVVNASPIGDCSIMLLALDAELRMIDESGKRRAVRLDRFFLGYKKYDLACGERIERIAIPFLPAGARYAFEKVSNRVILDIAAVNSALRLTPAPDGTVADLRLAAGGVAPVPLLVDGLAAFRGRPLSGATAAEVARTVAASVSPIDDVRGTADYKRLLLRQQILALFAGVAGGKEA